MATATTNEQRLDEAQLIIEQVLSDVLKNITRYNESDYRKLLKLRGDLTTITLRRDI